MNRPTEPTAAGRSWLAWPRLLALLCLGLNGPIQGQTIPAPNGLVRVAACQARKRLVDYRLQDPAQVLAAIDQNLAELETIIRSAGERRCDVLVLPEDTLGLLNWIGMNPPISGEVLQRAVPRMLDRLGRAAASHRMYLVVCSDAVEPDGRLYNTSFLLGRDGREIGRYHKVCPTLTESGARARGASFPVFPTTDLGTAGMLICYDLVIPETARCLALQGADIIFFPTMGGAAIGEGDIGIQALRVRAAENFVWLVVAQRGDGAMIISPQGKIVARAEGPDGLAIADLDPRGNREGGDAMNWQRDMRARLFRERNPAAFGILTHTNPPVLARLPLELSAEEMARIAARALTLGEEEFRQAGELARSGRTTEAIEAFSRLGREYPGSWIDRVSAQRLQDLRPPGGDVPTCRLAPYQGEFNYGLCVLPPWSDGGRLVINFPEHLAYGTNGFGILRHNDPERRGTWEVSADGARAILDVPSVTEPGVRVVATALVRDPGRIEFSMRITNGAAKVLHRINPLLCFRYGELSGFPARPNNLSNVQAFIEGRLRPLDRVATAQVGSIRKGGTVIGCDQRDHHFFEQHGGLIEPGVNAAITVVRSLSGTRYAAVAWTPGKSILANGNIPCIHADPFFGDLAPKTSAEARGVLLFGAGDPADAVSRLKREGWGAFSGSSNAER